MLFFRRSPNDSVEQRSPVLLKQQQNKDEE